MTTTTRLSALYEHLRSTAARSGKAQSMTLRNGARIAVAVRDGWTAVTCSRPEKPLGATEITVFVRDCRVPGGAIRVPAEGQRQQEREGHRWYSVSYTWRSDGH